MATQTNSNKKPGKSKYAKKIRRKCGNGTVDPRWMWWLEGEKSRRIATVVGLLALLLVPSAALAQEPTKPAKPVVCTTYAVISKAEAVCRDGKKPYIMTAFREVEVPGKEPGALLRVLVGWR